MGRMRSKKLWRILARILEVALLLPAVLLVLLQLPSVQTSITRKAVSMLEGMTDARISVGSISLVPFNTLIVKDITIVDPEPMAGIDTLLHADRISATFSLKGLDFRQKGGLKLDRVRADGVEFNLVIGERNGYENNLCALFRIPKGSDDPQEKPDLFCIRKADATNLRFRMINLMESDFEYKGIGINWLDMDLSGDLHGRDINFVDSRCAFEVTKSTLREKCGYSLNLSGKCITGMGLTEIMDIHIKDEWSDVDIAYYSMAYEHFSDWGLYVDRIPMRGEFRKTTLAMRSLANFIGALPDCPVVLDIDRGGIEGPVNDLQINNLKCRDLYSGVELEIGGHLNKICIIPQASLDANLARLAFDAPALEKLISAFVPSGAPDLSAFAPGVQAELSGRIAGPLNSLKLDCRLNSNAGRITLNAGTDGLLDPDKPISYDGKLEVDGLDLKRLTAVEALGPVSLKIRSKGVIPLDGSQPDIQLDSIAISQLTLLGYPYSEITAKGVLKDGIFDGWVNCQDKNMKFLFNGGVSIEASNFSYGRFFLDIWHADLGATGLDPRPGTSVASGNFDIRLRKTKDNTLLGTAQGDNLLYRDEAGVNEIGHFFLDMRNNEEKKLNWTTFTSDFMDFGYSGDISIDKVLEPVVAATLARIVPAVLEGEAPQWEGHSFVAQLEMKDTRKILSPLKMNFTIAKGTRADAELFGNGDFDLSFKSDHLAFRDFAVSHPALALKCSDGTARLEVGSETMIASEFSLDKLRLSGNAKDNEVNMLVWAATSEVKNSSINLNLNANLVRDRKKGNRLTVFGSLPDSWISIGDNIWNITEPDIKFNSDSLSIHGFSLINGKQSISADGSLSGNFDQKLLLKARDFNISTLTSFMKKDFGIDGPIEADLVIGTHKDANTDVQGSIFCPDLVVGGRSAGSLELRAEMDPEDFEMLNFSLSSSSSDKEDAIRISGGTFNLASNVVRAKLNFNDFEIGFAEAFVKDYCSDLKGKLNGSISINGNVESEQFLEKGIRCDALILKDASALVKPTGVKYDINAKLKYQQGKLSIDNLTLQDKKNGTAELKGGLDRLELDLKDFRLLDKKNDGGLFYGNLAVGGNMTLSGLLSGNMEVGGTLATSGSGDISIITAFNQGSETVLLNFTQAADSSGTDVLVPMVKQEKKTSMKMDCRFVVTPQVKLTAFLDKAASNVISATGNGDISIAYDSNQGEVKLGGDYVINEGKCHFAALSSLITRDFIIDNGSSVKFAGDPMDSELDIKANQILKKVSIGPLISDTTAVHTEKKVICGLGISNKLTDPELSFSIDVEDLDPATRSLVESELNTEDKLQKQFLALILTGNFLPSENTGITDNNSTSGSNLILKNLTSIMSGQVNSVLQKIGIPVDFGLSYQQNEIGKDIVDIALSTKLSDRVQFDGSIANRRYSTSSSDEMVGDFDVEIKLDKAGILRLKLFSHSSDDYTSFLDNSQRNGVGLSYQKEYDNLADYLRSLIKKNSTPVISEEPVKTLEITQ